jgi:hypothetical protein
VIAKTASRLGAAALIAAGVATAAAANKRLPNLPPGQEPPAAVAQQEPSQLETQQQAAPKKPPNCIADKAGFKPNKTFVIEISNRCELRVRCTVSAYIVTSRGPTSGRKVLTLAPVSKGAAAHKTYVIRLNEAGGMANSSHSCKVL